MGMYTEIFVNCSIRADAPADVIHDLRMLFDEYYSPEVDGFAHDVFKQGRMRCVGSMGSYYFQPQPTSHMWWDDIAGHWFICSRSDLKDYDGEIQKFFAWLQPYVDASTGVFIGYHRYEEEDLPTWVVKE